MHDRMILAATLAATLLPAQDQRAPRDALGNHAEIKVLYAGHAGNTRETAWLEFLRSWFETVETTSLDKLSPAVASRYDVIVADWRRFYGGKSEDTGKGRSAFELPRDWSRPTIMIGAVAGEIARALDTKIDWL